MDGWGGFRYGQLEAAAWLVEEGGIEVNKANKEGRTALMWACRNGQLAMARLLCKYGADVHQSTKKGINCLMWAVWGQSVQVAAWCDIHACTCTCTHACLCTRMPAYTTHTCVHAHKHVHMHERTHAHVCQMHGAGSDKKIFCRCLEMGIEMGSVNRSGMPD